MRGAGVRWGLSNPDPHPPETSLRAATMARVMPDPTTMGYQRCLLLSLMVSAISLAISASIRRMVCARRLSWPAPLQVGHPFLQAAQTLVVGGQRDGLLGPR